MSDKGLSTAQLLVRVATGVLIVVEVVLALGVLLQALAANPDAGFAEWALRNQDRVMTPFEGLFDDRQLGDDGVLDVSGLFAMAAYGSLFIPLGMARGWMRRAQLHNAAQRRRDADDARQARLLGVEPESPIADRPEAADPVDDD